MGPVQLMLLCHNPSLSLLFLLQTPPLNVSLSRPFSLLLMIFEPFAKQSKTGSVASFIDLIKGYWVVICSPLWCSFVPRAWIKFKYTHTHIYILKLKRKHPFIHSYKSLEEAALQIDWWHQVILHFHSNSHLAKDNEQPHLIL